MKGLAGVLFAGLVLSAAARAQDWQTYTYPDPGFAIQFPAAPGVQTTRSKNSAGQTLPVTQYVVRQNGIEYTLSVVNYSGKNADELGAIGEAAQSFNATGKVIANRGANVGGNHGRELTVAESDGSRSDVAIFFVNDRLYIARGRALPPNPMERSADAVRFRESLRFLADDSGFMGLFAGRRRPRSDAPASTSLSGRSSSAAGTAPSGVATSGGGAGGASGDPEHFRTAADQRADAACAGKSAGDIVQLETPTGRVSATCILTARPNTSN